ncbi:MAG: energy transducer TonB [Vicinamibacterales bacterium]|nr:energy transducer TonB [Vicinamibacterales bacterium]MDP7478557.1 energy transducer TonB [Vicinamibacterales bacterium]MDP7692472.1 energy transducer TonB [Vicinamibacterales bacterium]HJN43358.1 energy transducer TonB [Vicinamibacterales bacterium]
MSDGLNLGHIPFREGVTPYTPPERRARARRDARRQQPGAEGASGSQARATRGRRGTPASRADWLSLVTEGGGSEHVPFLGVQRERIRGALGASFASHALLIALIFLLIRSAPLTETVVEPDRVAYDIVWIPQEGPGGGGGGGGNESLEMPREVEVAGDDAVSVPIEVPEEVEAPAEVEPEPEVRPLEAQKVRLSAVPMAAAQRTRGGVMQGLMARSLDSLGSGTGGGAGEGAGGGIGPGQGDGLGPGRGGGTGGGAYQVGNGVSSPQLIRRVLPAYTPTATRARIEGEVVLDAVVLADGTVANITVSKSLDQVFGLDEEAIKAASQFRFRPGMRLGEPVAVFVRLEIFFNLL